MKYLCCISFGLHDIDIDAHDFYKWAKKEEENGTVKFLFLSIDDYERLLSFLSEACNGMKSVDGSMKLHAAFPSTPNKLWVRNTSCFCQNCFGTSFKLETACDGWRIADLLRKRNPSILSSGEKDVKIQENEVAIFPDINDHVAAEYDSKVYIGKVLEIDDSDAKISFYEHAGTLSIGFIFHEPKKRHEIWVDFVNTRYVVPVPAETKRGKKLEKFVLEKFSVWKNFLYGTKKTGVFFMFFIVLDIQCDL